MSATSAKMNFLKAVRISAQTYKHTALVILCTSSNVSRLLFSNHHRRSPVIIIFFFLSLCMFQLFVLSLSSTPSRRSLSIPSIHPHPAARGGGGGLEMYFIFYGRALQGTENKKDQRKEAARRKEDQGVYTQTFCVERREINFTIISHGSVCRFCSLRAR